MWRGVCPWRQEESFKALALEQEREKIDEIKSRLDEIDREIEKQINEAQE